jgi:3-oxoacyl-[acyl-carrier protein] reductase
MLNNQVAIITGATGSIGGAIALRFYQAGALLVIPYRSEEALIQFKSQFEDLDLRRCLFIQGDLLDPGFIQQIITETLVQFNKIDILVNNAGKTADNLILRMKDDAWDEILDINLKAPFQLLRAVLKPMLKAKSGKIINIGSVVGVHPQAGQANYAAAKAGLHALTKSAALEVASRGILINAIAPGYIQTAMTENLDDVISSIPLGRMGKAYEVASLAYFLATEANYITGQIYNIDGGLSL